MSQAQPPKINVNFEEKMGRILFTPKRYKVFYGGRGGMRSWSCAMALIIKMLESKIRVLCVREVQKSIRDSVHKVISDQIERLGFGRFFDIQEAVIKSKNGSECMFSGLSNLTADQIKSYEGIDICWAEEAHSITKSSWDILIPTIRKENSEIWITFNPNLETDETYVRFIKNTDENCFVLKTSYLDNPWFPGVLEQERKRCQRLDPDNYPNIWLGECRPAVEGAIYYREISRAIEEGRVCKVPYDPMLKVHIVFDLGFNNNMAICLVQKNLSEIRIIDFIKDSEKTLDYYSGILRTKNYNWGRCWLPHDGYSQDFKTGYSSAAIMRNQGWDVPERHEIAMLSVEEGIRAVKMAFPRIYFDKESCGELIEDLKRYRRKVSTVTGVAGGPLHDQSSDSADCLRYVAVNIDYMDNVGQYDLYDDYDYIKTHSYNVSNVNYATGY